MHVLSDEKTFQSYIHIHMDHLYAIVMHSVIREMLIFVIVTVSACVYFSATVEINSILDETSMV